MNIDEAVNQASKQSMPGEVLNVVGNIEKDAAGKVRVYPDPYDMSRFVLIDPKNVSGEVLDVTDHAQRANPSRRGPVFSVPVRKGAEIQIVSVKTIAVKDVARMRFLSLDQSGACGCSAADGDAKQRMNECTIGNCVTVEGVAYDCYEYWEGLKLCSGCCLIASA
jgi:hypothetical protein